MSFVQSEAVIPVDLHVTQYRTHPEDDFVEVWGYVEDYEVCVQMSMAKARACGLLPEEPRGPVAPRRKSVRP